MVQRGLGLTKAARWRHPGASRSPSGKDWCPVADKGQSRVRTAPGVLATSLWVGRPQISRVPCLPVLLIECDRVRWR